MSKPTPLYRQYLDIKKHHPDAIVMFRLGDFYEMFDEDAEIAARELDLVFTGRQMTKGAGDDEDRNPMCGVPHHAVEGYIAKLAETLAEQELRSFKVGQQIRIQHTDLMDDIEQQKAEAGDGD